MKVVVMAKYVPEPTATWSFEPDHTLARDAVEGRLSELDEYAVEQAVRLKEGGVADEVVVLTVGPAKAVDGLRKALAMGADRAVHVSDEAVAGSDALGTSKVLAAAAAHEGYDLILTGMASTDAEMSVVPSMVAARLGVGQATFAGALSIDSGSATIRRDSDTATREVSVDLPAVISLTDQTDEARYPAFRAIMMAKKKPVETRSLADIGVTAADVGLAAAATSVVSIEPAPQRQAGTVITDDGSGASQLADFLAARGFVR